MPKTLCRTDIEEHNRCLSLVALVLEECLTVLSPAINMGPPVSRGAEVEREGLGYQEKGSRV